MIRSVEPSQKRAGSNDLSIIKIDVIRPKWYRDEQCSKRKDAVAIAKINLGLS